MATIYDLLYWCHVPVAMTCVPAFWIATLTKKGGKVHVRVGRWFAYCMIFVALTGSAMGVQTLIDPSVRLDGDPTEAQAMAARGFGVFLLYLGTITGIPVHHGVRVIRTRREPGSIRTPLHTALCWLPGAASVVVIAAAFGMNTGMNGVLLGMSPIGFVITIVAVGYLRNPTRRKMEWWYQHMFAMLVGGIAAHTAFATFFIASLMQVQLPGIWNLAPWILPTVVGVPAMVIWIRTYERKFEKNGA